MRKHFQRVRRDKILREMSLQHDNARPHTSVKTREAITQLGRLVLPHPPYSPAFASLDFHLFGPLKDAVFGRKYWLDDDLSSAVRTWFRQGDKE